MVCFQCKQKDINPESNINFAIIIKHKPSKISALIIITPNITLLPKINGNNFHNEDNKSNLVVAD